MKPHSPEQVNGPREFGESVGHAQSYELGPWAVDFFVVHIPEEQRPFPRAVAAAFTEKSTQQSGVVAVSDDVPESLRGLWALHELIDFTELGRQYTGRCAETEGILLNELYQSNQSELANEYKQARQAFYRDLQAFMRKDIELHGTSSQYHPYDVDDCNIALVVLNQAK